MTIRFNVDQWAAWAPGLADRGSWLNWLDNPRRVSALDAPALAEMPPMMRRRVDRVGRAALQAAYWCQANAAPCPVVFASRYGDMGRSVELLTQLATENAVSPAGFSLSVHNAIGALYSIARGDTGNFSAVAAGAETVEAAFVEALGLLEDDEPAVMVVFYEEPLPAPYRQFGRDSDFPHGWACLLSKARSGGISVSPTTDAADSAHDDDLPADLAVLRFLVSGAARHHHGAGKRLWQWQRHD